MAPTLSTISAELDLGQHVCYIYDSEEEHALVVTEFLLRGIELGDKILYLVDAHTESEILGLLRRGGVDPEPYLSSGQLTIKPAVDGYVPNGVFEPDAMIEMLHGAIELATAEGYRGLRATGELTWALKGFPGSDRTHEYEMALSQVYPGRPALGLCQYDRRAFDPDALARTREIHPCLLIGALLRATRLESQSGLRFQGQIDASNAPMLAETLSAEALDAGRLRLDLEGLDFIDASGLRALHQTARAMGGTDRLSVASARPMIQRMLALTGWPESELAASAWGPG